MGGSPKGGRDTVHICGNSGSGADMLSPAILQSQSSPRASYTSPTLAPIELAYDIESLDGFPQKSLIRSLSFPTAELNKSSLSIEKIVSSSTLSDP